MTETIAPGTKQFLPLPYAWFKAYQQDPVAFMLSKAQQFGHPFRLQAGPIILHTLVHPDHVQHVLHDKVANYPRGLLYYVFRPGIGSGLITTDGESWRSMRGMADEAFEHHRIDSYAKTVTDVAGWIIERWAVYAKSKQAFDLSSELLHVASRILGKTILGVEITEEAGGAGDAIRIIEDYINFTITHVHPPPTIPTFRNLRLKKALHTVDSLIYRLIAERRKTAADGGDVLSALVSARDKSNHQGMSDLLLRDNALSIFFAGHETIAYTLAWMWYLLARNPQIADRLHDEVISVLGDRTPTLADLGRLTYAKKVLQETLRLYPSVWLFEREAVEADTIAGYHIPKKSQIILVPYLTHRLEEVWPNPNTFDPERFSPKQVSDRHPYAYLPYCAGPHQCIGEHFSMMVMQLIVAMIVQAYRIELVDNSEIEPQGAVTVAPRGGVMVTVRDLSTERRRAISS